MTMCVVYAGDLDDPTFKWEGATGMEMCPRICLNVDKEKHANRNAKSKLGR